MITRSRAFACVLSALRFLAALIAFTLEGDTCRDWVHGRRHDAAPTA
jgi:hypothetical protein